MSGIRHVLPAMVLLGCLNVASGFAHSPPLASDAGKESRPLQPVIVLSDSDCLEYLWFARLVRHRLVQPHFEPAVVHIRVSPLRYLGAPTQSERIYRRSGFLVTRVLRLWPSRAARFDADAPPSLLLIDGDHYVVSAYRLGGTARAMYAVTVAVLEQSRWRTQ